MRCDHQSFKCPLGERSQFREDMQKVSITNDKPGYICYACWLPHSWELGSHGGLASQDTCRFSHILQPLIWCTWNVNGAKEVLFEHFNPRLESGQSIDKWEDYFVWVFGACDTDGLHGYCRVLEILLEFVKRSTVRPY